MNVQFYLEFAHTMRALISGQMYAIFRVSDYRQSLFSQSSVAASVSSVQ